MLQKQLHMQTRRAQVACVDARTIQRELQRALGATPKTLLNRLCFAARMCQGNRFPEFPPQPVAASSSASATRAS